MGSTQQRSARGQARWWWRFSSRCYLLRLQLERSLYPLQKNRCNFCKRHDHMEAECRIKKASQPNNFSTPPKSESFFFHVDDQVMMATVDNINGGVWLGYTRALYHTTHDMVNFSSFQKLEKLNNIQQVQGEVVSLTRAQ